MTQIRLDGRVAVVTGSGRGIGRSVALELAARGARVVVNDLGVALDGSGADASVAGQVVKEIRAAGGEAAACTASVTTEAGAREIIETATDAFGAVDILVNNAGILRNRMSHRLSADEWDSVLQTHLYGTFYCMRAALPLMRERNFGRIVNMTSASALIGAIGQANYMAAKMGIVGLTRGVALDQQSSGIKANCLSPSAVTRMVGALPEDARPELDDSGDLQRVAEVVTWMSSAEFTASGQVFGVRGPQVMLYGQHRPVFTFDHGGDASFAAIAPQVEHFATPLIQVTDFFGAASDA
ncbi:MAG TPA: SDR family NAD(P)-dependent oxidoreductase [Trebonia sp.]|nr:SDR family NAD(P)-dependent oxidoreductase [Trebonia sp.]